MSFAMLLSGCQVTYVVKSAYFQASLLSKRVPIEKALNDPALTEDEKRKLRLAREASAFAETELGLKRTTNYSTFVNLGRPYVTYVVTAAARNELKAYTWWFPVVGSLPYKGFFDEESAKHEAEKLKSQGYDVYVRGVSAYSTLGWFSDPILSGMLLYKDHDLVDTIIHETVHATIYIKSEADFNERLATFIGQKGAEEFYKKKEGTEGPTVKLMRDDEHDHKLFSAFMSKELESLEKWYQERSGKEIPENERQSRLQQIRERFTAELRPRLKLADSYRSFEKAELNNARLINYRLYFEKLSDFEAVFVKLGGNFRAMLDFCKSLEKVDDPRAELERVARATP